MSENQRFKVPAKTDAGPISIEAVPLRDYFAARAMHGILRNNQGRLNWSDDLCAQSAYEIADAMLKAREQ